MISNLGRLREPREKALVARPVDGSDRRAELGTLDRTIDNQVARLRKKVERDPARPLLIKTVRGVGYVLTESPTATSG